MNPDRLELLLHRHFDQLLTQAERVELSTLLLSSPKAREEFWRMARWHALIRQWGESEWGRLEAQSPILRALPPHPDKKQPPPSTESGFRLRPVPAWLHPSRWAPPVAAAAAVFLCLFLLARFAGPRRETGPRGAASSSGAEIAMLSKSCEAVWADAGSVRIPGQALHSGLIRLAEGAVQIDFARGARVVLEGPADFELLSDNESRLHSGKLRAYVPEPAHGFLVRTRDFNVVDLGTEFGCQVPRSGASELHVFQGQVSFELPARPESGRHISQNEALIVANGRAQDMAAQPSAFLDETELARREIQSATARAEAWRQLSRTLGRDHSALVHLDFQNHNPGTRSLTNKAHRSLADGSASIVGCEWVSGRWPQKQALEFSKPGDRIRLSVPGLFESISLLSWVQSGPAGETSRSLLCTESDQPGEIRWILQNDGSLTFSLRTASPEDAGWRSASSPAIPALRQTGRWQLLSTVFDGSTGTVRHFLNGTLLSQTQLATDSPLRLDTFEIGNSGLRSDENLQALSLPNPPPLAKPHPFNGRMDEFLVFSSPLDQSEIQRIFELGSPAATPRIAPPR